MTTHVDQYRVSLWGEEPIQFIDRREDQDMWYAHTQMTGESYWNGYVWGTAPHEDGECEEHRPERINPV